ncbi:hypothetical protein LTLLF_176695 [Microtus ochrogaster]|uniref:KIAA0825 ortholog n=1 Tax=Microtus ochrogaster TaxID=79684 RepID=A0A8J6KPU0_MICOH|nr:hypothetical protein LTLLF_176695 [Microtus ochrogaster]
MNGDSIKNKVFASHIDQEIKFEYMKSCQDLGRYTIGEFWKENNSTVSSGCPQDRRHSSSSLHELRFLSQLTESALKLEKSIQELFEEAFLLLEMPRNAPGIVKKSDKEAMGEKHIANEVSVPPEPLLPVKEAALLEFDWRNVFKESSLAMGQCISTAIEGFSTKVLQQEQMERTSAVSYTMNLVNVPKVWREGHIFPEEEQPKKFCSDIMEKLDTMLPLALACRDDSLQEIRGNFVEGCCKVARAVLERLQERGREVPSRAPLKNLHILLSTATYLSQHFMQYDNLMRKTTKKPIFLVPVQQYQEFINTLQFQLTDYCVRVCATSILQDAESHRWDDHKAFYEGERCSFSVQMWHYFSWALRHDLWTILPAKQAQEILARVLEKSLCLLASRYAQACPSPKRTAQIRLDVTTILICTEKLLWSVCTSVQEILNPHEYNNHKIFKIHTHCNNLFTTLAILTSPLTELYKPASAGGLNAKGQLKLLLSQPCCKWNLLLETLLHGDGLIPRILLKSSKQAPGIEKGEKEGCSVVEAIFKVLYHCHLSPQTFGHVFMSYMEDEQLWDFLCSVPVSVCTESQPEVIHCLRLALMDAVKDTVQQVISVLRCGRNHETDLNKPRVPDHLLQSLPREWGYIPRESRRKEPSKGFPRLAAQAVSVVISKLPTVIACLPPTIKYFFFLSERKMSKNLAELKKAGLLVWNLIVIICRIFEDGNTVERLTGAFLDRRSKEKAAFISVCLESILGERSPCQLTQKVILSIERQNPNWMEHQLLRAKTLSINCAFLVVGESSGIEGDAALELTEQKTNTMVLDLCHKPGGSEYLRRIYHIMRLNEDYLKEQLSATDGSEEKPLPRQPLKVTSRNVEDQPPVFNPFHVQKMFSENMLDQAATATWCWNWSNLLPNYLRVDKMTFGALLRNSACPTMDPCQVTEHALLWLVNRNGCFWPRTAYRTLPSYC